MVQIKTLALKSIFFPTLKRFPSRSPDLTLRHSEVTMSSLTLLPVSLGIPLRLALWRRSKPSSFKRQIETAPPLFPQVTPGLVSPPGHIPDTVSKPNYDSIEVEPILREMGGVIWTEAQIEGIRGACRLARRFLDEAGRMLEVGVTTQEIDGRVHEAMVLGEGKYPSILQFQGFPKSISISVNNIACHGVPDDRPLERGDLVSLEVGVFSEGFHGDCADSFIVGGDREGDEKARRLKHVARECLHQGANACGPGESFRSLGHAIYRHSKRRHIQVVRNLCGHGIGDFFCGPPDIYHVLNNYPGKMLPGMVFTIEPCVSDGSGVVNLLADGVSVATVDGARAAQCGHTVLITEYGAEMLTL